MDDEDREKYLRLIRTHAERQGVKILAWCLMSNHVHFVAIPSDAPSLARAFGEAHRLYTRAKNLRLDTRGYLFQGRFWSCVLDEPHLVAAARYVEQNPIRAGMVNSASEYRWSSARFHLGLVESDALVTDRSLLGLVSDWSELLAGGNEKEDEKMRSAVRTGRPMGDERFVARLEKKVGRTLTKRKPGRPRQNGSDPA